MMPLHRPLRVSVLQHVPFEGPASAGSWLRARGHHVRIHRLWLDDAPPTPESTDLAVIMGGPMAVYESDRYRWMARETHAIERLLEARVPLLGICLGAQLVASALGATVYPAPTKEIGWWPVEFSARTDVDPSWHRFLSAVPARLTVMHWHADTFALPSGAVRFASTTVCPNQGFLYGRVTTDDGAVHQGRLRFGRDEEAFWGDYFNGSKGDNPWATHASAEHVAERLLCEGFQPAPVGHELEPPKEIFVLDVAQAALVSERRPTRLGLTPELLAARHLVLVPFARADDGAG